MYSDRWEDTNRITLMESVSMTRLTSWVEILFTFSKTTPKINFWIFNVGDTERFAEKYKKSLNKRVTII